MVLGAQMTVCWVESKYGLLLVASGTQNPGKTKVFTYKNVLFGQQKHGF